ncbi:MAG: kynureninase [Acidimicrobiia bacterium]|nr:kynureninase [Acidimicrobiia bacterium]
MIDTSVEYAQQLDSRDPLAALRDRFAIPRPRQSDELTYLVGHSLGLQPKAARDLVIEELDKWADLGVAGHFRTDRPWAPYHESIAEPMAKLVGALPREIVAMNGLTVNLHLLMASFYRPTAERHEILIEDHAFPSDHYVAESQLRLHGYDPGKALITVAPRPGTDNLDREDILETIAARGERLALVLLPGIQYYTGQVLPMAEIVAAGHRVGANVGLDLAHAAGNIEMSLHDWGPDFAAWCTYKYLNSGPGSTAIAYVHERHLSNPDIPRLEGWWGHDKASRFDMDNRFVDPNTAEAWQMSNSAILSTAPVIASLGEFERAGGMGPLRAKAERIGTYLDSMLDELVGDRVERITPGSPAERGSQVSLRMRGGIDGQSVFDQLLAADIQCDWRFPDVIRVAPTSLYNTFSDVHRFTTLLSSILS